MNESGERGCQPAVRSSLPPNRVRRERGENLRVFPVAHVAQPLGWQAGGTGWQPVLPRSFASQNLTIL